MVFCWKILNHGAHLSAASYERIAAPAVAAYLGSTSDFVALADTLGPDNIETLIMTLLIPAGANPDNLISFGFGVPEGVYLSEEIFLRTGVSGLNGCSIGLSNSNELDDPLFELLIASSVILLSRRRTAQATR